MLNNVQTALAAIKAEGTFATVLICGSADLKIEVKGVGPIRFPVSAAMAAKLCAAARPAPFGRRDKTLHDSSVRDTWQLGRTQVKIDTSRWKHTLDAQLPTIKRCLGLPEDGRLDAVFDKMLVYGPGQFFPRIKTPSGLTIWSAPWSSLCRLHIRVAIRLSSIRRNRRSFPDPSGATRSCPSSPSMRTAVTR